MCVIPRLRRTRVQVECLAFGCSVDVQGGAGPEDLEELTDAGGALVLEGEDRRRGLCREPAGGSSVQSTFPRDQRDDLEPGLAGHAVDPKREHSDVVVM